MISEECLKRYIILPDISSIKLHEIDDDTYFGPQFRGYVSNSKLKLINPDEGGSFKLYLEGLKSTSTNSLLLGSAVHQVLLQEELFEISDCDLKPTAKAGAMVEVVFKYRSKGYSIMESILNASNDVDYYQTGLTTSRIKDLIKKGLLYYLYLLKHKNVKYDRQQIYLDSKTRQIALTCLDNVRRNTDAMDLLRPDAFSLDHILNRNEDCITLGIDIQFPNSLTDPEAEVVSQHLDLKIKIDNWSINFDQRIIYLNDLKTSGKPLYMFPGSTVAETGEFIEGSWEHYHYFRQVAYYSWILLLYLKHTYRIEDLKTKWNHFINMVVVSTVPPYNCAVFKVNHKWLLEGYKEFIRLLKYAAYAEYNKDEILKSEN